MFPDQAGRSVLEWDKASVLRRVGGAQTRGPPVG